jgi:hypothetical protein
VRAGLYVPANLLSSVVGVGPAHKPRLVIAVMIDEPTGTHYGGLVAAPAFKAIAEAALRYLGVAPSEPVVASAQPSTKAASKPVEPIEVEVDGPGIDEPTAVAEGEGESVAELDPADEDDDADRDTERAATVAVPDFSGMSIGEAVRAAHKAGIELFPSGSGVAVGQTPHPGSAAAGTVCRVSFRRGGG